MDLKTKFTAGIFSGRHAMREQGNQIARDMGFTDRNHIDSFRHAYVAGKLNDNLQNKVGLLSSGVVRDLGMVNEIGGLLSNTSADRESDLLNNEVGLQIAEETRRDVQQLQAKYSLTDEEAEERFETMFRDRISQAVKQGRIRQLGNDETPY